MQLETDEAIETSRTFGVAYEALYFNGRSFEYFTDVTYCFVRVFLDESGTYLHQKFIEPVFKYQGNFFFSVLIRMRPSTHERRSDIILPPGLELPASKFLRHALSRTAIDVRLWDDPAYRKEGGSIGDHSVMYLSFVKKDERVYPTIITQHVYPANLPGRNRLAACKRDGDLYVVDVNVPQSAIDDALRKSRLRDGRPVEQKQGRS